jgi:hypothetical protein
MRNQFIPVVVLLTGSCMLSACGGGASSGESGVTGNANILGALDASSNTTSNLPEGTDSVSLGTFWEKQVLDGFTRVGQLKGYAYADYRNLEIKATAVSNTIDAKGGTVLLVTHPDHHAQTGDWVTFTGLSKDQIDIPFAYLNGTFEITSRDANSYFITVPYATSKRDSFGVSVNLYYKLKECEGVQTVVQTPALATTPVTFFDGFEARVAKHTVQNSVSGCSPPEKSFTTYKYFAVNNPKYGASLNHPFIGQRIEGGDFYSLDKTFDLPLINVQSGQSGTMGIMKIYKSSNKTVWLGTSYLTYQILSHTANSVFIVISTTTYNDINNLISTMTEVYGKDSGANYKLIRTTVKYNNPRRNEIVIE